MNKTFEQVKEKAIVSIVLFMLTTGGLFLYNFGLEIWRMPETVKRINDNRINDSIQFSYYRKVQDSINRSHKSYLEEDYLRINNLEKIFK